MLTLCSTALGGGVLSIAYMMKLAGVFLGCLLLLIAGCLAFASISSLMRMSMVTGKQTYAAVFSHCAGARAGPVLDAMLFTFGMGSCIGYMVFLGDFIPALVRLFGGAAAAWDHETVRTTAICCAALLILPLGLAKDISILRFISPVSIFALLYMACVVSFKSPGLYSEHLADATHGPVELFNLDSHFFEAFALCVFAFNCHLNVVPVAASMVSPSKARIRKISYRVNVLQFAFYCLIGVTGYLSFLSATKSDILLNYDASDGAVAGGRFMLSGTMLVGIPMNLHPTMRSAMQIGDYLRGQEAPAERPWATRAAVTVVCIALQALVAIKVPNVGDVLGLLGGSVATAMMFFIPAFCMRRILPRTKKHRFFEAMLWFFAMVGFTSVPIKVLRLSGVMPP